MLCGASREKSYSVVVPSSRVMVYIGGDGRHCWAQQLLGLNNFLTNVAGLGSGTLVTVPLNECLDGGGLCGCQVGKVPEWDRSGYRQGHKQDCCQSK